MYSKAALNLLKHEKFGAYFYQNWDKMKSSWAAHMLKNVTNFGNLTNNFLESTHQKLKRVTDRSSSIPSLVEQLLLSSKMKNEKAKDFGAKINFKVKKNSH